MENNTTLTKLRTLVIINYALQGSAILLGGIPSIIAVIIAYLKKEEAKDTYLYSHFNWQLNTFWGALAIVIIGLITLMLGIGVVILVVGGIWVLYRIIKGVMYILENKAI